MYICDTKHSLLLERVTVCFYSDAGNVHPGHEICYNFRQLVFHLAVSSQFTIYKHFEKSIHTICCGKPARMYTFSGFPHQIVLLQV